MELFNIFDFLPNSLEELNDFVVEPLESIMESKLRPRSKKQNSCFSVSELVLNPINNKLPYGCHLIINGLYFPDIR
jgi:hypothetical protein